MRVASSHWWPVLLPALLSACGQSGAPGGEMPAPEVGIYKVQAQDLPVSFEYVGETAGSREVEIRARVSGILEQRAYREGTLVKAGQPLFVLDAAPFQAQLAQAQAELASAQARLQQAQRELARVQPLLAQKAISQKDYDTALSTQQLAQAGVQAAQAQVQLARLNLGYTRVSAPIGGIAGKAQKSEGSLLNAAGDSLLTTVVQIDPLYVNFSIPDGEQLRINQDVAAGTLRLPEQGQYRVALKLSDGSAAQASGKLMFVDSKVNNRTGSIDARAEVPNPSLQLRAGQFVRVALEGAVRPQALAVPQGAVLESGQGKFVYVIERNKEGKTVAQARTVQTGEWVTLPQGKGWVVRSGLKSGEQVIIDNLVKIRPGAEVKPAAAGKPAAASAPAAGA